VTTEAPEFVYGLTEQSPEAQLVRAINRLAQAIEQATLAKLDAAPTNAALAQLPPVRLAQETALNAVCPIHNEPWKVVPAGISKKTGNPYEAFKACPIRGCDQRPR
jgi:hypothetical protein